MDPFVKLVKEMRHYQKLFFQHHMKADLYKAKRLEAKIDSMIENYNVIEVIPPEQLGLFQDNETRF